MKKKSTQTKKNDTENTLENILKKEILCLNEELKYSKNKILSFESIIIKNKSKECILNEDIENIKSNYRETFIKEINQKKVEDLLDVANNKIKRLEQEISNLIENHKNEIEKNNKANNFEIYRLQGKIDVLTKKCESVDLMESKVAKLEEENKNLITNSEESFQKSLSNQLRLEILHGLNYDTLQSKIISEIDNLLKYTIEYGSNTKEIREKILLNKNKVLEQCNEELSNQIRAFQTKFKLYSEFHLNSKIELEALKDNFNNKIKKRNFKKKIKAENNLTMSNSNGSINNSETLQHIPTTNENMDDKTFKTNNQNKNNLDKIFNPSLLTHNIEKFGVLLNKLEGNIKNYYKNYSLSNFSNYNDDLKTLIKELKDSIIFLNKKPNSFICIKCKCKETKINHIYNKDIQNYNNNFKDKTNSESNNKYKLNEVKHKTIQDLKEDYIDINLTSSTLSNCNYLKTKENLSEIKKLTKMNSLKFNDIVNTNSIISIPRSINNKSDKSIHKSLFDTSIFDAKKQMFIKEIGLSSLIKSKKSHFY